MDIDKPIKKYKEDLDNSNDPDLRKSWIKVLKDKDIFTENCELIWKDDNVSQLDFNTDLLLITKQGRRYSIDTKTRNSDNYLNPNYILEIASHRYKGKELTDKIKTVPGWLYKSPANYIFWGTLDPKNKNNIIEVMGFTLTPFKNEDFKQEISKLRTRVARPITDFENGTYQQTILKLCSLNFIKNNADDFKYKDFNNENDIGENYENEGNGFKTAPSKCNLWGYAKR